MKVYSQLEKAQLENTTSDTGSLAAGMVTYRTDQNIPKVSNGTAMKELVTEDIVQTVSNKTLASPKFTTEAQMRAAGTLKFFDSDNSNYLGFKAPAALSADKTLELPNGVGANGQVLTTNGVDALSWVTPASGTLSITSKTANYTVDPSDNVILCDASGGAFTITLYPAASNSGKTVRIKKTDTTFLTVTIDGNSSETIDGFTTRKLVSTGDTVTLLCDGSNWHVIEHTYFQGWSSYTPTGSHTANTTYTGYWMRVGANFLFINNIQYTGVPTNTSLNVSVPTNLTIDTTAVLHTGGETLPMLGQGHFYDPGLGGAGYAKLSAVYSTSTTLLIYVDDTFAGTNPVFIGPLSPVSRTNPVTIGGDERIHLTGQIPITDWW